MTRENEIAIAYHSGYGHTARQARAVAAGADGVAGARVDLHDVATLDDGLWAALAGADAIIFGSPTYMGGPSAVFQAFAEASSHRLGRSRAGTTRSPPASPTRPASTATSSTR